MSRARQRRPATCREVGKVLQSYLDGEVDELTAARVARHLEACLRCGMSAETYVAIKRALGRGATAVDTEVVDRLRAFGARLARDGDPGEKESPGA